MGENPPALRLRVGGNVMRLRLLRGLTQEQLAERAGNTGKHIGQVERGELSVGIDYLAAIASALEVDVTSLFTGTDSDAPVFLLSDRELAVLDEVADIARRLRSQRAAPPTDE